MAWRVLVVDDSAFMRRAISEMVASDASFEVIGTARDGLDALAKIEQLRPDMMTLDVEMPNLNGIDTLRRMREIPAARRPRVLMCSSLTTEGSRAALTALSLGAADCVAKDSSIQLLGLDDLRKDVVEKLRAIAPCELPLSVPAGGPAASFVPPSRVDLIAVGSSTGGPPVIERLVHRLPPGLACPVVVAQHMPSMFTRSLAERLGQLGSVRVAHAASGVTKLVGGVVYIIEGGLNGHVVRGDSGLELAVMKEPEAAIYRPSVNILFSTAAKMCGRTTLGVVYTGMGDDGLIGGKELAGAGGKLLAQDAASCVVYGMPRALAQAGIACTMTPDEISRTIGGIAKGMKKSA